jgi:hypothetical protein
MSVNDSPDYQLLHLLKSHEDNLLVILRSRQLQYIRYVRAVGTAVEPTRSRNGNIRYSLKIVGR